MSETSALIESIVKQIVAIVEPSTRFDRSSLPVIASEIDSCRVSGTHVYRIVFRIEHKNGHGPLPSGVRKVSSKGELDADGQEQIASAHRHLPARLRDWLSGQTALPGRTLLSGACHDSGPPVGYAYHCENCRGKGQVTCTACGGQGGLMCMNCLGSGKKTCSSCQGTGKERCLQCGGSGTKTEYRERRVTNYADNTSHTESYTEQVWCPGCGGGVSPKTCSHCSFGKVRCSLCNATGKTLCYTCNGKKEITCSQCDGSGFQHVLALLNCSIEQSFALTADTKRDEAKTAIESLDRLEKLCALTSVGLSSAVIDDNLITRHFETRIPLAVVTVRAAGEDFEIFGYGDVAQVFNFKNIVSSLLKSDLDDLEQVLKQSSRLPLRPLHGLDNALRQFLASEVNTKIGAVAGANRQALQDLAAHGLKGAVSGEYAFRAAKTLRTAVSRVFRSEMLLPAVIAAAVPTMTVLLINATRLISHNSSAWTGLFCGLMAAFVAEQWALARYRERFDADLAQRAVALLRSKHTLWWWRLVMLLAAIAWIFGIAAFAALVQSY